MDWPAELGGELVELRPGTKGWSCAPDDPANPVNETSGQVHMMVFTGAHRFFGIGS
jgi:hypothetical protein